MASIKAVAIGLFSLLCATASAATDAPAATLSVGPSILTAGGQATVKYFNPAKAGQQVVVEIDDGGYPTPKTSFILVTLDNEGAGTGTWTVPTDWDGATFNAPGAVQVTRAIR